jgi:CheY-like chemotaxis protein
MAAIAVAAASVPRQQCLEAGMDAYVSKPLQVAALFGAIESLVPAGVELSVTQERVGVAAVRAPASPAQSGVRGEASEGGAEPPSEFP